MVLKYRINYARAQTELELTEKESASAMAEFYSFVQEMVFDEANCKPELLSFSREKVGVLQLSQYFDIGHVNQCIVDNNPSGLNGALLHRIVTLIKRKQLFGDCDSVINFDNCIFEIYDPMFEDFCVLINSNMPVPSEASIRIKLNTIRHMFTYASQDLINTAKSAEKSVSKEVVSIKAPNNDDNDDTTLAIPGTFKKAKLSPDARDNQTNRTGRVFSNSQRANASTGENGGRRRRRRGGRNLKASSNPPSTIKRYPPLTKPQVFLFKDIIKAFRDETILREIDRESRRLERIARERENGEEWLQRKMLNMMWTKVVTKVSSLARLEQNTMQNLAYMVGKYQQLYHLCVCVRYLDSMEQANSYLEAVQCYDMFNYIHGKVMAVFYLLDDLRIPTACICGICDTDSSAIIVARNAFRDKQIISPSATESNANDSNDNATTTAAADKEDTEVNGQM